MPFPMRREAPRAAPAIDKQEGRKNELEIKMRNGGLLSSELLELQTIRAEIASAAAEEEAQKQAMKEQFKREIEEEDKRAAERLVRLEQEAIAREIQALSIKKEHKEREAKLNSRPESRPPRRTLGPSRRPLQNALYLPNPLTLRQMRAIQCGLSSPRRCS